jgi:hypothetical protein
MTDPGIGTRGQELTNRQRANHHLIEAIMALWDAYPDQRFGQLVMNLSRTDTGFADIWEWKHGKWFNRIGVTAEVWQRSKP